VHGWLAPTSGFSASIAWRNRAAHQHCTPLLQIWSAGAMRASVGSTEATSEDRLGWRGRRLADAPLSGYANEPARPDTLASSRGQAMSSLPGLGNGRNEPVVSYATCGDPEQPRSPP
jgi:hypothetical protein